MAQEGYNLQGGQLARKGAEDGGSSSEQDDGQIQGVR